MSRDPDVGAPLGDLDALAVAFASLPAPAGYDGGQLTSAVMRFFTLAKDPDALRQLDQRKLRR